MTAYIGLGANLGDRAANIQRAVADLAATAGIRVVRVASLLENDAVGGPSDSPAFLNGVAEIETTLGAFDLLNILLEIEARMGRRRRLRWEPRVIDLDLLLYGDQTISDAGLTIPHPSMHQRRFVLAPLAEIAPKLIHPVLGKSIRTLLDELPPAA